MSNLDNMLVLKAASDMGYPVCYLPQIDNALKIKGYKISKNIVEYFKKEAQITKDILDSCGRTFELQTKIDAYKSKLGV